MDIKETLKEELKRLNRLNVIYEKNILAEKYSNEPELIVNNVSAMCQIASKLVY